MFWESNVSGAGIWTIYEALLLWFDYGNGWLPFTSKLTYDTPVLVCGLAAADRPSW